MRPRTRSRGLTIKKVITDLGEARRLAAAGLLWYRSPVWASIYTAYSNGTLAQDTPVSWEPCSIDLTGKHWQFYLLLEE